MSDAKTTYSFVSGKIAQLDNDSPGSRAACARLRRAIGKNPGATPDIWDFTLQGMPPEWDSRGGKPSHEEWAVHTALTLYALHRQGKDHSMNAKDVSFGAAVSKLVQKDLGRVDAVRRRFNAVATATDFSELANHARGLVQLFKSDDIAMDYSRFAVDLFYFLLPGGADQVRLRWAEDFYRFGNIEEAPDGPQENENKKGNDKK